MSLLESAREEIVSLDENRLQFVVDYLAFLRFQSRPKIVLPSDETLVALYAEFGEEDRIMAAAEMADYARGLALEDSFHRSDKMK